MELYETEILPLAKTPHGDGWQLVPNAGYQNRNLWRRPGPLLEALQALLDWGREHTSPRDPNSPHALLVAAQTAIDDVTMVERL